MNQRKKILFATIAGGVVILGLLGYLCYTDWEKKGEVERESQDLRGKITRAETEIATVGDVEKRVLILRNRLQQHVAILPDDERINNFVDKLTGFAKEAGVTIERLDDSSARRLQSSRRKAKQAFERVTYKLDVRCNTDRFLRFIDLFENEYERFVRVPAFTLSRESRSSRKDEKDANEEELTLIASLTLETYVYNPKARGYQQVPIRQELAKTERLRREGLLDEDSSGLDLVNYDFEPSPDRRDPFVDPRIAFAQIGEVTAEERQAQSDTLEGLKSELRTILSMIAAEQSETNTVEIYRKKKEINESLKKLRVKVLGLAKDKYFTAKDLAVSFREEVEVPVSEIIKTRNVPDPVLPDDVRQAVTEMTAHLEQGEYDKVLELYGQLAEMKEVSRGSEELSSAFKKADEIKAKAEAYKEFATKKIELGGCIVYRGGNQRTVAIINNRSFSPGEAVEEGLVVKSISPSEVTFTFRGVTVVRKYAATTGGDESK